MSKRKPAAVSKPVRPKIAAKAQRAKQAVVKSPKGSGKLRSVTAAFPESPPERLDYVAPAVSSEATAVEFKSNAALKGFDFSSASANYVNLLDMAQANLQFTLEFAQRFAAIRSPVEFRSVIAEFTSKRIAMFQKYSKTMVETGTSRAA
jgi:hypothetical protein